MFQEGNYDVTTFPVPVNGMNQSISPDMLPQNFCYLLENIIPDPIGSGQVRYGTTLVKALASSELEIIRSFKFVYNGYVNQAILYVGYYAQDLGFETLLQADEATLSSMIEKVREYFA